VFLSMTMAGWRVALLVPRILRDQRLASLWFATQAVGIAIFWLIAALTPVGRNTLLSAGFSGARFWAFAAADLTIIATGAIAAIASGHRCRNAWVAMLLNAAVSAYPAAYFTALAVTGGGGELAAILMTYLTLTASVLTIAAIPVSGRIPSRTATRAKPVRLLVKTTGELALIWTVLVWLVPSLLARLDSALGWSSLSSAPIVVAGILVIVGGGLLTGWSAYHMAWRGRGTPFPMDAPNALVIDGPYRFVRNPQVVGGVIQGVGLLLLNPTPTFIGYVVGGVVFWQLVLRPWEESDLLERFGEPYQGYRRQIPCWRPRIRSLD
jgi:protein-S-isoprenylcysteine O-methyltransferase Ste14